MPLPDFLAQLDSLVREATAAFEAAADNDAVEAARIQFLGAKSGRLKEVQKGLGKVDKPDKPEAGKKFNEAKNQLELCQTVAIEKVTSTAGPSQEALQFDPTVPGIRPKIGRLHPITQATEELKDIMGRLGFSVADGPEVEDRWHNFEALNIPASHPARDPLDNFYLAAAEKAAGKEAADAGWLLRSQTSTVQIRVMEENPPPVRIVSLGRVYRPDTADATHYPMFHQIEGLLVDTDVTMADLKTVLRIFCSSYLGEDVHVRFRPSFFPFTEPSVEVDMQWGEGWVEREHQRAKGQHVSTVRLSEVGDVLPLKTI